MASGKDQVGESPLVYGESLLGFEPADFSDDMWDSYINELGKDSGSSMYK